MYVNIEILDAEPIENVITAMHYRVDKTIFVGYKETIKEYATQTEYFLRNYCGVEIVEFKTVSETSPDDILEKLREVINAENTAGNQMFFDITGGDGLILVAFGMLAQEYKLPIHQYDVISDTLLELNSKEVKPISSYEEMKKEKLSLSLDTFITMQGAAISKKKVQGEINTEATGFRNKVEGLWNVLCEYRDKWNFYAEVLRSIFKTETLCVDGILDNNRVHNLELFENYLKAIEKTDAITKLHITSLEKEKGLERRWISFYYDSEEMKRCLIKGGNTLELYTYYQMKKESDDCKQSVMIDWDGIEYKALGIDVLNEIDVLCIKGNIPTFVSCKSGRMDEGQALEPMYELLTVANHFGGKYAKKILVLVHPLKQVYMERAQEMGIEIKYYDKESK